jgi:twitching motility two-component system response regulator PilG
MLKHCRNATIANGRQARGEASRRSDGRVPQPRSQRRERRMATNPDITGLKVMVIDDSSTIRRSAEIFLVQAGCQVILADDGFDALAKINDYQPDLIFCDILMPRLDGYQTCSLIKKSARFSSTPVVMLSSKDGLFDRARGRMVGSDEYLTKPFTKDSLLKTVDLHARRVTA